MVVPRATAELWADILLVSPVVAYPSATNQLRISSSGRSRGVGGRYCSHLDDGPPYAESGDYAGGSHTFGTYHTGWLAPRLFLRIGVLDVCPLLPKPNNAAGRNADVILIR